MEKGGDELKKAVGFCLLTNLPMLLLIFIGVLMWAALMGIFNPGLGDTGGEAVASEDPKTPKEWKVIFKNTESKLKIPWEFVAAIAYQESGMGNNFGGCSYFPPPPPKGHVLVDGNGLRNKADKDNFETISGKLSIPKNQAVSCNPTGSNGGAMGYLQVMPSEWMSYSKQIEPEIGHFPNPWLAQDASHMAGLILKAKIGLTYDDVFPENEASIKRAAARYYGSSSSSYKDKVYAKYLEIKNKGTL